MDQAPTGVPRQRAPVAKPERARAKERRGRLPRRSDSGHKQQVKASPKRGTTTSEPEVSAGEAALTGGEPMRRGNAKHCRAARNRTNAQQQGARGPSPRAFSAKRRTIQPRKRSFRGYLTPPSPPA